MKSPGRCAAQKTQHLICARNRGQQRSSLNSISLASSMFKRPRSYAQHFSSFHYGQVLIKPNILPMLLCSNIHRCWKNHCISNICKIKANTKPLLTTLYVFLVLTRLSIRCIMGFLQGQDLFSLDTELRIFFLPGNLYYGSTKQHCVYFLSLWPCTCWPPLDCHCTSPSLHVTSSSINLSLPP